MNQRRAALASALLLAACGGGSAPARTPDQVVQDLANKQGVQVKAIRCSKLKRGGYGCTAQVASGGTYECAVTVMSGHDSGGACFLNPRK